MMLLETPYADRRETYRPRRRSRPRRAALCTALVVAIGTIAACGDSEDASSNGAAPTTAVSTSSQAGDSSGACALLSEAAAQASLGKPVERESTVDGDGCEYKASGEEVPGRVNLSIADCDPDYAESSDDAFTTEAEGFSLTEVDDLGDEATLSSLEFGGELGTAYTMTVRQGDMHLQATLSDPSIIDEADALTKLTAIAQPAAERLAAEPELHTAVCQSA